MFSAGNTLSAAEKNADSVSETPAQTMGGSFANGVFVSIAEFAHHVMYFGAFGWKDVKGGNRVPTPEEVVEAGFESPEYLDQFKP